MNAVFPNTNIGEIGVLRLLFMSLGGETLYIFPPTERMPPGSVENGMVRSNNRRGLFNVSESLSALTRGIRRKPRDFTANADDMALAKISKRREVINHLIWQSVREEYPCAVGNWGQICEGWILVGKEKWVDDGINPFPIIQRIREALVGLNHDLRFPVGNAFAEIQSNIIEALESAKKNGGSPREIRHLQSLRDIVTSLSMLAIEDGLKL